MRHAIGRIVAPLLLCLALSACAAPTDDIYLISREDGSGTRSAFSQLTGVTEQGHDHLDIRAEITNSTSVVMLSVAGSPNTIGYLSLGSLSPMVRALAIDGVTPTPDHVLDGSYPISRPFLLATRQEPSPAAEDFLRFVCSEPGQAVLRRAGYAATGEGGAYTPSGMTGRVSIDGSTSVAPVLELISEEYQALNPGVVVELQQSGSSAGISSVRQGVSDIGMSSRDLSAEEAADLRAVTIAMDAIAVVVSPENPVTALTLTQVRDIFTGRLTTWRQVTGGGV